MKKLLLALSALCTLGLTTAAIALPADQKVDAKTAEVIASQLPSYPINTCLVSGEELGEDAVNGVVEGRLFRACCPNCAGKIKKSPADYIAKIDAAVIKAQLPSYPLEGCAVSGKELGSMGDPINYVHGTRLVRFCCKGCVKGFQKNPAKALKKVDAALIAAQKKTYPTDRCLISDEPLGDEPVDMLYGTRLVRVCCKGCIKGVKKNPASFFAKLDALAKKNG